MQLWKAREGQPLTLGDTGIDSDIVVAYARDGHVEVIIPEPDRGETAQDAMEEAARRKMIRYRQAHEGLTKRKRNC